MTLAIDPGIALAPVPCLADRASCRLTRAPAAEPHWRDHLAFLSDRAIAHRQVSVLRGAQKVVAADRIRPAPTRRPHLVTPSRRRRRSFSGG